MRFALDDLVSVSEEDLRHFIHYVAIAQRRSLNSGLCSTLSTKVIVYRWLYTVIILRHFEINKLQSVGKTTFNPLCSPIAFVQRITYFEWNVFKTNDIIDQNEIYISFVML